jgi:hypothetical protein
MDIRYLIGNRMADRIPLDLEACLQLLSPAFSHVKVKWVSDPIPKYYQRTALLNATSPHGRVLQTPTPPEAFSNLSVVPTRIQQVSFEIPPPSSREGNTLSRKGINKPHPGEDSSMIHSLRLPLPGISSPMYPLQNPPSYSYFLPTQDSRLAFGYNLDPNNSNSPGINPSNSNNNNNNSNNNSNTVTTTMMTTTTTTNISYAIPPELHSQDAYDDISSALTLLGATDPSSASAARKRLKTGAAPSELIDFEEVLNPNRLGMPADGLQFFEGQDGNQMRKILTRTRKFRPINKFKKGKKWTGLERCHWCQTTKTPEWRYGPDRVTLCNACGLQYKMYMKKGIQPDASGRPIERQPGNPNNNNNQNTNTSNTNNPNNPNSPSIDTPNSSPNPVIVTTNNINLSNLTNINLNPPFFPQ